MRPFSNPQYLKLLQQHVFDTENLKKWNLQESVKHKIGEESSSVSSCNEEELETTKHRSHCQKK